MSESNVGAAHQQNRNGDSSNRTESCENGCNEHERKRTQNGKHYVDDLTHFMAWQNWYLVNYNSFLLTSHFLRTMHLSSMGTQTVRAPGPTANGCPPPFGAAGATRGPHQQNLAGGNTWDHGGLRPSPFNNQNQASGLNDNRRRGVEASLAPLHKRIAAELIDSIVLLTIKLLVITLILGDKYVEKFQYILVVDDRTTIEDLEAMLMQALLFRAVVIAYETICLSGTIIPQTRGMTLGKRLMKLRVIKCEIVETVDRVNNKVRVMPGNVLGFWSSLLRAFLKSFIVSVLFPMLIPLNFVAFHNRLIYDLISGSIVVQDVRNMR